MRRVSYPGLEHGQAEGVSMQALKTLTRRAGIALVLAVPCVALATPPAWAPAHGARKKSDPTYSGYSGREWDYDYGVRSGSCDRGRIGQVLGGVVGGAAGGAIGAEVAKGSDHRDVAIVVGTVVGAATVFSPAPKPSTLPLLLCCALIATV